MSDKSQMPRMKSQEKDNALEVKKHIPEKNQRHREEIREKVVDGFEQDEVHHAHEGCCGCCDCEHSCE